MEMPFGSVMISSDVVSNVSTVTLNGISRKVIQFSNGQWIEGIGNSLGLFAETWGNVSGWERQLHCMSLNDSSLYQYSSGILSPSLYGTCALTLPISESAKSNLQFSVYPNPTNSTIQINISDAISYFEITNVLGESVFKSKLINNKTEIDLSAQKNGIYFIRVFDKEGNSTVQKIVKQ